MNFRLSDVVFNSWITVWCLLNWKRKLCRYVCTMYVCYKCVCVWGYVYTMVCVGVWGHPHLLHCLRQGLSCCLPLHYVLQASWPGVSCFSFLSCHMSEGITEKPPCPATWFCGDMGHQACGAAGLTHWATFFWGALLSWDSSPFHRLQTSLCCKSCLKFLCNPNFWVLLACLDFCSQFPVFSRH